MGAIMADEVPRNKITRKLTIHARMFSAQDAENYNRIFGAHGAEKYNRKLQAAIRSSMAHQPFRKTYYDQANMDPASVHKMVNEWAASKKYSAYSKQALRRQVNVRSAAEFRNGISQCVAWLAICLRNTPRYALLVEISHAPKSSTWLAGPVVAELEAMGIPKPEAVIPCTEGGVHAGSALQHAVDTGITAFVHVDDAIYSGSQKTFILETLQWHLSRYVPPMKPVDVYVAAAYSTRLGRDRVLRQWKQRVRGQKLLRVHFFAARDLQKRSMPLRSKLELVMQGRARNLTGGPTMTILSHKVPNAMSFGPASLSKYLTNRLNKPVYKGVNLPNMLPKPRSRGYV